MKKIIGKIDSLFLGVMGEELIKRSVKQLEFHLDGIIGDRHAGFERVTWEGDDKQAAGTKRRNERQWSAISKAVSYTHLTLPTICVCRSRWSPYH